MVCIVDERDNGIRTTRVNGVPVPNVSHLSYDGEHISVAVEVSGVCWYNVEAGGRYVVCLVNGMTLAPANLVWQPPGQGPNPVPGPCLVLIWPFRGSIRTEFADPGG